ncbi:MAG TPA: hypothetical protein VH143_22320, partial [Kofleriaceae bacterium]|nr:hypothetical protein [Kofleriaceae bacterium]
TARADAIGRFFTEARAVSAIRHPGIVEVFDFGYTDDGSAVLAMELLDGETLKSRISRGPLREHDARAIGFGIATALAAAHASSSSLAIPALAITFALAAAGVAVLVLARPKPAPSPSPVPMLPIIDVRPPPNAAPVTSPPAAQPPPDAKPHPKPRPVSKKPAACDGVSGEHDSHCAPIESTP